MIQAYGHIDSDTPELAISVLPEHRGQGVGTMLMNRLFELLRARRYRRTSLSVQRNNPAVRFYKRLGYQITDEKLDHAGHEDYIMVKNLMQPIITAATRGELYEVAAFLDNCWRVAYKKIIASDYLDAMSVEERHEKLLARFDETASDFLVMRDADSLVGVSIFGKSYTDGYPDDGEISAIYLRRDYIGKGHGHALLAKVEAALAARGCACFILDVLSGNGRAIAFYHQHGYEMVDEKTIRLGGTDYPLTVLRKTNIHELGDTL